MTLLNPQQKQALNQFRNQPSEKQAEEIANLCNQKGISKNELAQLINSLRK